MRIFTSIKITFANKKLCYKTLVYKFVICAIFLILFSSLAKSVVVPILESDGAKGILSCLRQIINNYLTIDKFVLEEGSKLSTELMANFNLLFSYISSMSSKLVGSAVALLVALLILTFFDTLIEYVVAVNVNEHMSSICHAGIISTLIENFKKASVYAIAKTLFLFIYNAIIILIVYLTAIPLIKMSAFYALTLIFFLAFIAVSIRIAFTSLLLPYMVCENLNISKAFNKCFDDLKFSMFLERVVAYFLASIIAYSVVLLTSIITFGIALLITIPIFTITFVSIRFVDYYNVNQLKYYITYDEIYVSKKFRSKDEQLLNEVDM